MIESSESLATLTKYDVHNTFEADHIRSKVSLNFWLKFSKFFKYHQFESFVQRVSKSQDLVKTIFSRRILRFTMLLIWQFIIYQVYLNPSHQLSTFNCPLPAELFLKQSSSQLIQSVPAVISSTSLRLVYKA